jgi:hypothetical protein
LRDAAEPAPLDVHHTEPIPHDEAAHVTEYLIRSDWTAALTL